MNRFAKAVQIFSFALIAVGCLAPISQAQQKETLYEKVVTIEGITEYRFKNGLRFLSYPDPSASTVTINMTVLVGSRHEGYGEAGMAHLLEHMLFKGQKLYPTQEILDKAVTAKGVSKKEYNATTWVDRTNYYETFPSSDDNLRFALEMEADRLYTAFIRREDLKKEMSVVRNEFERGEDSPSNVLSQRMYAAAFEWHNYGKSTIGNRTDIERYEIDRLQAFYRKYYRVDNVVLTVTGKFDEKKALAHVSKYFGTLKAPATPIEATYTEEPAQDGEHSVIVRRVGKTALVGLLYHIPAASHEDNAACEILGLVLGDEPSGRLYKELVEKKKVATSVNYNETNWYDPGVIEFGAEVHEKATPEEVRDLLIAVVEGFKKKPFTDEEVARMVKKYQSQMDQMLTKSTSTAFLLNEWIAAGDWRLMFIHRDRIAKLKAADVNRVAEKYLTQTNRTVGMFIPTSKPVRSSVPEAPDIAELVKNYKGGKAVAEGEAFDATPENIEKRVKRFTLSNGLKVALFPKKSRGETVVGRLTLHFGNEESLVGHQTAAGYVGAMMMRGTKNRTRQQIQEQLDALKSSLSVGTSVGSLSVSWETKRKEQNGLLDLLREVLREPTFPEADLLELKQSSKQTIEQAMTDPGSLARNALRRALNPHPMTSIHYVPTFEESLQRLAKLTRDDVVKLYQDQIGATHGELAIVGDFDPEATIKQIETILAGWKSNVPYKRIPSVLVNVKGLAKSIETPDRENAVYVAAMRFAMDDSAKDYAAMEIGNEILGGGSSARLWMRLREKEGFSYGAGSRLSVGDQDKVSQFSMSATCKPDVIDKVDKAAGEELRRLLKDGVTEAEVKLAITATLENMRQERGKDAVLASSLREGLYLGRTYAWEAELESKIASVTVADVNRAMAERLSIDRLVIIRAGDFKKKK